MKLILVLLLSIISIIIMFIALKSILNGNIKFGLLGFSLAFGNVLVLVEILND